MNTEPRLKDFLGHILEAVDRIESFSAGMDEAGFLADIKTQDAVIRNLEVIGEACNNIRRVAPEFAGAHPEVPWGSAIGSRNALSHGYFPSICRWFGPRSSKTCVNSKQRLRVCTLLWLRSFGAIEDNKGLPQSVGRNQLSD